MTVSGICFRHVNVNFVVKKKTIVIFALYSVYHNIAHGKARVAVCAHLI